MLKKKIGFLLGTTIILIGLVFGVIGCKTTDTVTPQINTIKSSISSIESDINDLNTTISKLQNDVSTATSSSSSLSSRLSALDSKVSGISSSITNLDSQIQDLGSQDSAVKSIQSKITDINNQITTVNKSVTDLQSSIKSMSDTLSSSKADIEKLKKDVLALTPTTTTTTPTTTTPTTTGGLVSVNIAGNPFTGSTVVIFPAVATGATVTQSFTFTVNNQTTKGLATLSLALGLQTSDTTGTLTVLPTTAAVSIVSGNTNMIWNSQSTGVSSLLGFIGNMTNNSSSVFNTFVVNTGVNTYTHTITIKNNSTTDVIPSTAFSPIIFKVLNYTTQ